LSSLGAVGFRCIYRVGISFHAAESCGEFNNTTVSALSILDKHKLSSVIAEWLDAMLLEQKDPHNFYSILE
jgi:hypothetical protein